MKVERRIDSERTKLEEQSRAEERRGEEVKRSGHVHAT